MAGRLIALLVLLLVSAASAQTDPMRPPGGLGEAARPAEAGQAPVAESLVQTVILRPGTKPIAVVGGEQVTIGSRIGDARVVKISESEVVLAGPAGREVLKVNPDVDKRVREAAPTVPGKPHKTTRQKSKAKPDGEPSK